MNKIVIGVVATVVIATAVVVIKNNDDKKIPENDKYISCTEICNKDLINTCDNIVGNIDNCEANCNEWTPSMKSCVKKASKCEELDLNFSRTAEDIFRESKGKIVSEEDRIKNSSNCTIVDDDYSDIADVDQEETRFGCSSACYKYKKCAGFSEGVGEKGMNEAYDTCFEQCQKWSKKTLDCFSKIQINSPTDCMPLTMCGLSEYHSQGF